MEKKRIIEIVKNSIAVLMSVWSFIVPVFIIGYLRGEVRGYNLILKRTDTIDIITVLFVIFFCVLAALTIVFSLYCIINKRANKAFETASLFFVIFQFILITGYFIIIEVGYYPNGPFVLTIIFSALLFIAYFLIPFILRRYFLIPFILSRSLEVPKEPKSKPAVSLYSTRTDISVPDEIAKFKKLLDDGVITQEEFDVKKQELLKL